MIAYLLQKKGIDVLILEANTRIGGRIEQSPATTEQQWNYGATCSANHINTLLPC
jgi:monoamine oxidase